MQNVDNRLLARILEEAAVTSEAILMMYGGIGLFLCGMKLMGNFLERYAGAGMGQILELLTNNKAKGVASGAGATAVTGANIGTAVKAQILRLGYISSDNAFSTMLKPASFALICTVIGDFIR